MTNKNLGKVVSKAMKKKGIKKLFISKLLKISRPTLNTRLSDGAFSDKQIEILKKEGLI